MTEEEPKENANDAVRALIKRSLAGSDALESKKDGEKAPDLLKGVQRKIRQRSKGKFYSDGWSTSQARVNYVLIALSMLLLAGLAYYVLGPTGFSVH